MQFSSECNRVDPLVVLGLSRRPHKGLGIRNTSSSRLVFQNLNHFLSSFFFFSAAFLFIYSQSSSFSSQSCTAYSTLSYCNNNNLRLGICERGLTAAYVVIGAGRSVHDPTRSLYDSYGSLITPRERKATISSSPELHTYILAPSSSSQGGGEKERLFSVRVSKRKYSHLVYD